MSRTTQFLLALGLVAAAAPTAGAQSLESRVNGAPDGRVMFNFAARPGVCGNGRSWYSTAPGNFNGNFYSGADGMRMEPCVAGPVRVVIDRADKLPLSVQTYVGPPDSTVRGVTDLGHVRAQDAVDYLLSLSSKAEGRA